MLKIIDKISTLLYLKVVSSTYEIDDEGKSAKRRYSNMKGYISSAIDMEEGFTRSVYHDYMEHENWPDGLNEETLEKVRSYLQILIKDTQNHKKRFVELKKKFTL